MDFLKSSEGVNIAVLGLAAALPHVLPLLPEEVNAFLNVASVSTSFGTHIWVGSIAGITMF